MSLTTATGARRPPGTTRSRPPAAAAANYAITDVDGTLTVSKAPLTVSADSKSKAYGGADPTLSTSTPSGALFYGDTYSVISGVALATAAGAAATAGTHAITVTGGTSVNYAITDVNGTLTVSKALAVIADDKTKTLGAPDPALTFSVNGNFYYGDGPVVVSGVALSTTTGASATVGTHPIIITGGTAANYAITDVPGTLTVTASTTPPPALVTLTHVQAVTNKKHLVTQIVVTLSGPVNATEAQNVGTYRLATAGKKNSFDARNAKLIKLKSAVYNAASNTVTLIPKKPFALTKPVQIRINGQPPAGLQDSLGRLIDGDHNGQPGGNAAALLRRGGATISAVAFHPSSMIRPVAASASTKARLAPARRRASPRQKQERDHEFLSLYQEVAELMQNGKLARQR